MAQEILTGNVLSDGIVYHASDINAAVNNATILPAVIEDKAVTTADPAFKALVSNGTNLISTTLQSIKTFTNTNLITAGVASIQNGVAFPNNGSFNVSGTLNDYVPASNSNYTMIWLSGTATLTGIVAPSPNLSGTLKIITCFSGALTISRRDAGSAPANQFNWGATPPNFTLTPGQSCIIMYSTVNNFWQLLCTNRVP